MTAVLMTPAAGLLTAGTPCWIVKHVACALTS